MNFASAFFGDIFTEAIGWFLIHSIWQGSVIALLLFVTLQLLKNRSAQLRHYISFAALVLLVASSSLTFHKSFVYAREKAILKEAIITNPGYLRKQLIEKNDADRSTASSGVLSNIRLERIKLRSGIQFYFPWIVSIWIIGLLFYLLRVSGSLLYLHRLRTTQRKAIEQKWLDKTMEFCQLLKIRKRVGIYLSVKVKVPITVGYFKPLILVPASLIAGLSPEMLEAIIAHEIAHIRRNDYLMNLLQTLIETLFFYHPGVWYISSQIRRERELACDDIALDLTSDRISYAKALTVAQEYLLMPGSIAQAFAIRRNTLLQRIKRLNTKITMKTNLFEKLTAGFLILSAFLFFSFIVDGNNPEIKERKITKTNVVDSISEPTPKILFVHKTNPDTSDTIKKVRRVYKVDKEEIDSLITAFHAYDDPDDELEKMIEIVLTEQDPIEYEEIMRNVQIALSEIELKNIKMELKKAAKEMERATHAAMHEGKDLMELKYTKGCDSLNQVIMVSVNEAMDVARQELENMDFDSIVNQALLEANQSIADLDIEFLISDALKEAQIALEDEHVKVIKIQKELRDKETELAEHELNLKEKEADLKQQLKELEEQLKEVKQKQKEESRNKQ